MPSERKKMQNRLIQVKYREVSMSLKVTMKITAVKDEIEKAHMSLFSPAAVISAS